MEQLAFIHHLNDDTLFGSLEARAYFKSQLGLKSLDLWRFSWLTADDKTLTFTITSLLTGKTYVLVVIRFSCGCE